MPEHGAIPGLPASREFVLGGQKSGKSRRAEALARGWLEADTRHQAVLIATARAGDDEMRARIARHRQDRSASLPALRTVEEPLALDTAVSAHSRPDTLVIVDCLGLWLTNRLWPVRDGDDAGLAGEHVAAAQSAIDALTAAIVAARGPLVLVGNEIGLGVIPMGWQLRVFVDALGLLNQTAARLCDRVTWMVAGIPMVLKGGS